MGEGRGRMGPDDGRGTGDQIHSSPSLFLKTNNPLPFQEETKQGTMTHCFLVEERHAGPTVIPALLPSWENDLIVGLLWPSFSLSEGTFFSTGGSRATLGELGPEGDSGASSVEYHEQKGEKFYLVDRKGTFMTGLKLNTTQKKNQETARICVRKRRNQEFTSC